MPDEPPRQVMMSVPEPDAIRQAEFIMIQRISNQLDKNEARMEKIAESLHDVQIRVVRIESNGISDDLKSIKTDIARLWARIEVLEADRNARSGSMKILEWFYKLGPWIAAAVAGWFAVTKTGP